MNTEKTLNQRRERRFVTCDQERLQTETFIEFNEPVDGTVVDISAHGLRVLSSGKFEVGQPFVTELKTDRLHGVFPGIIRHVQPWMDGKSVLGCQLFEAIPDEILETLAREKVINRRDDERFDWKQSAKMSWELQAGEVDIEIQDCSQGGLMVSSQTPVPDDVCVRIRFETHDGDPVTIAARTAWQKEDEEGYSMGLAFSKREVPQLISDVLANGKAIDISSGTPLIRSSMRPSILIAAAVVVCGFAILQSGLWG